LLKLTNKNVHRVFASVKTTALVMATVITVKRQCCTTYKTYLYTLLIANTLSHYIHKQ